MNEVLRIALIGGAGRMGQAIRAVAESENTEIVATCNSGEQICAGNADVIVDFSSADAMASVCGEASKSAKPLVIGTTGHSASQRNIIQRVAEQIPVVLASNFSVGVNVLFSLAESAAAALGDGFDVEIVEIHHRMKKDAPSGTAKTLAEIVQGARKDATVRHGREGNRGCRDPGEIGIHAIRGGDVVGEHTLIFAGNGERLELTHRAGSRETFARGALRAAHWITGKAPGLYSMRDVLAL